MNTRRQVLFIQGGGAGVHDEWDDKLVASLRDALGPDYALLYPRMPNEADPDRAEWIEAITAAIAALDAGAILVGHSIGAALLLDALAQSPPERAPGGIFLLSAPFIGEGGWPSDDPKAAADVGVALPGDVPIHVYQGLDDETVPPSHADLHARRMTRTSIHRLPGRDHQLGNDLSEVADDIRSLA